MKKTHKGFTLFQIMMGLFFLVLLFSLGFPNFQRLLQRQKMQTNLNYLLSAIRFARSYAIMHHKVVVMCASRDGQHCLGNWSDGYLIFCDQNRNYHLDPSDEILRVITSLQGSYLTWQGFTGNNALIFQPSINNLAMSGHFTLTPFIQGIVDSKEIFINRVGRVRVAS